MQNYGVEPRSYSFIERLFIKPFFTPTRRWCGVLNPAPNLPPEGKQILFWFVFKTWILGLVPFCPYDYFRKENSK